jgi:hypothetical protein
MMTLPWMCDDWRWLTLPNLPSESCRTYKTRAKEEHENQGGCGVEVQCNPAHTHKRQQAPAHHRPQCVMVCDKLSHRW